MWNLSIINGKMYAFMVVKETNLVTLQRSMHKILKFIRVYFADGNFAVKTVYKTLCHD